MRMQTLLVLACVSVAGTGPGGSSRTVQASGDSWRLLTPAAPFPKSYNFQIFSIRDTLWVLHHEGTWYSVDGSSWQQSPLPNVIRNNAFLDYVWFNNALYCLGTFDGNVERFTITSAIHRTTDMRHWENLADSSNLPRRFFYHPFVFDHKLWIIGGTDGNTVYADVWSSPDAVHWTRQADGLPFGPRQESQVVFFHGKLMLLNNDVWSSADGIHWTRLAARMAPEQLFGYAPVIFDGLIWLLGCNRNNVFKSEAVVSGDGITWTTVKAPWSPRGGATACLHNGAVIMTGGKYGGLSDQPEFIYSNDVWMLEHRPDR